MLVAVPVLARVHIDPAVAASLRQGIAPDSLSPVGAPDVAQWLIELVPANVFKAAADGAMLPLIVFTLAFGFALTRVPADRRSAVAGFFSGLADAMMVLVRWIIRLAPIGVLALAAPLAARMGAGVAGALLSYVLLAVVLTIAALALIIYPVTVVAGGVSFTRLARGAAPAQALALLLPVHDGLPPRDDRRGPNAGRAGARRGVRGAAGGLDAPGGLGGRADGRGALCGAALRRDPVSGPAAGGLDHHGGDDVHGPRHTRRQHRGDGPDPGGGRSAGGGGGHPARRGRDPRHVPDDGECDGRDRGRGDRGAQGSRERGEGAT